jgi:hypothetical protein
LSAIRFLAANPIINAGGARIPKLTILNIAKISAPFATGQSFEGTFPLHL